MPKFTDKLIAAIPLPEKGIKVRTEGDGLYIIVSPKGMRKWQFTYRWQGKQKWIDIGRYPAVSITDARKKAREYQTAVDKGVDPLADNGAGDSKFLLEHLVDEYLTKHAKPRKKSWKEDERILHKDVLPAWRGKAAADIKKRDVIILLEGILDRGAPISSNMALRAIRKVFNFAVEKALLETSPVYGIKPLAKQVSRDRVLTDDEIRKLWHEIDECLRVSPEIKRALKLTLVTGLCRMRINFS